MRVGVAEDHIIYRAGLVRVLTQAGFEVIHEAGSGPQLLDLLDSALPDVVILDIRMQDRYDGLRTAEALTLRHPDIGILMLSERVTYHDAERFFSLGTAGRGFVLKGNFNDVPTIQRALHRIGARQTYSDPEVLDLVLPHRQRNRLSALLTPRERETLAEMAQGLSNTAIAQRLHVSVKSVEAATSGIFRKLGLSPDSGYNPRVLAVLRWNEEAHDDG